MARALKPDQSAWGLARDCRVLRHVPVRMRDGIDLAATVYLPRAEGRYPAVLVRMAYNRLNVRDLFFPRRGLALVVQDTRGRYESGGRFYPFVDEERDGRDTLDWLARQPWCDGRVGMYGDSYLAAVQLYLAPTGHRALRAICPRFMAGDLWKRAYYCDGAFSLALTLTWLCFECRGRMSEAALLPLFDVPALLRKLPLATLDQACGAGRVPWYRDYVTHNAYGPFWKRVNVHRRLRSVRAPALLIGGWYDNYPAEAAALFTGLRRAARTRALRDSHRLLIGPWTHGVNAASVLGEVDFGPAALAENDATQRWLEALLHDRPPASVQKAPVRVFVMGVNRWRNASDWPLPRTRWRRLYLRAGGRLSVRPPAGAEPPDGYAYDPENPVPTLGGNHSVGPYNPGLYDFVKPGPYDQRPIERRPDVLVYTSEPLARDLEVIGPVALRFHAASSARDTDFVAKLTDVFPDGRSINLTEGIIRARFRRSVWGRPRLLTPGRVAAYTLDMQVTANVFRKGHRIRLLLTSSNFPLWDRNRNTGDDPATDIGGQVANQSVFHDRAHPSHLVLPVIPGSR